MLFNKKDKRRCDQCGESSNQNYNFCPYCGNIIVDHQKEQRDYGLLGRNDSFPSEEGIALPEGFGISDRIFSALVNGIMKSFDKQFKQQMKEMERELNNANAEITTLPNGVRIKITSQLPSRTNSPPKHQPQQRRISEEQLERIAQLPKEKAKTTVKRLGNKIIYELITPGLVSVDDIFVSKLESGYEIKAIGDKKVYVNSIPVNLPLKRYLISDDKLFVEFNNH